MENQIAMLQTQMTQVIAAINAMAERIEGLEGHDNAVIEGDEVQPKATQNGKLRKSR